MKYLCFDIESCDGGKNGSLCSFGYCIADESFNILDRDDIIVNPDKPFNKKLFGTVLKLAYTEEVFRSAPRFPLVYDKIRSLFSDDVTVIGFSVINDVNYLSDAIRTYKLEQIYYEFYDVQLMYSIFKKAARTFSLSTAAAEFDIEFLEHRSLDDAVATLKVLKGILDSKGVSFKEFIEDYGIMPGRINNSGIRNCFTDTVYSEIDYSSIKTKKRLLNEFMLTVPRGKKQGLPFSGKVVCFDETIELDDIVLTRNRIAKLYELGGRYSSGVESSNVFVYQKEDSARFQYAIATAKTKHGLKLVKLDRFLNMLGDVPDNVYDDEAILRISNRRRRLNHERASEMNRRIQKSTAHKQRSHSGPAKQSNITSSTDSYKYDRETNKRQTKAPRSSSGKN